MRYPLAIWDPGEAANYRFGRTSMDSVVCHYTVGRNSTAIGRRGYFQFLVSRDGTVTQFSEADSVNWHAGSPWNSLGPGIEIEYLPGYDDELFTPEAYHSTALLVEWLASTFSIPFDFYDGPRRTAWNGFITHRSLIQTGDYHNDWWPELPRTTTPDPEPTPETEVRSILIQAHNGIWCYDPNTHTAKPFDSEGTLKTWSNVFFATYGKFPEVQTSDEYVAILNDAIRKS